MLGGGGFSLVGAGASGLGAASASPKVDAGADLQAMVDAQVKKQLALLMGNRSGPQSVSTRQHQMGFGPVGKGPDRRPGPGIGGSSTYRGSGPGGMTYRDEMNELHRDFEDQDVEVDLRGKKVKYGKLTTAQKRKYVHNQFFREGGKGPRKARFDSAPLWKPDRPSYGEAQAFGEQFKNKPDRIERELGQYMEGYDERIKADKARRAGFRREAEAAEDIRVGAGTSPASPHFGSRPDMSMGGPNPYKAAPINPIAGATSNPTVANASVQNGLSEQMTLQNELDRENKRRAKAEYDDFYSKFPHMRSGERRA